MKRALSTGWLYLVLLILALMLLLVFVVPEELFPKSVQDIVQKIGINKLGKSPNRECAKLSESECLANLHKGCVPGFDLKGSVFLDCRTCKKGMSCTSFAHPIACVDNPCGFDCRWIVGEYRDGYTIYGKCVENEELTRLKRELNEAGFDASTIAFGKGLVLTRIESANCTQYTTKENDTLIIDHAHSYLAVMMHDREPVAYDRSGSVVPINTLCGGTIQ
jgi:hypothetical protein